MNIPVEKLELIERIIKLQDPEILQHIKDMLSEPQTDWWDHISEAEKRAIEQGLAQAEKEPGISHEQAMKQILAQRKI
jgi:thiamine pyrophosphate-dependent acetolactate synthase large subunit-like protein